MRFAHRRYRGLRRPGLTLIECMIAMTILPLTVVAISYAIVAGQAQSLEALAHSRAGLLAEALMEEIVARPYDSSSDATLGPDGGETARSAYDSATDFHGLDESAGTLVDAAGVSYPDTLQGFDRAVSCEVVSKQLTGFSQACSALEVTVTVERDGQQLAGLKRLIVDAAAPEEGA